MRPVPIQIRQDPDTYLVDRDNKILAATYDDGEWPVRVTVEMDGGSVDRESLELLIEHLQELRDQMQEGQWVRGPVPLENQDDEAIENFDSTPWVVELPNLRRLDTGLPAAFERRMLNRRSNNDAERNSTIINFPTERAGA